jgi:hypothetical protein
MTKLSPHEIADAVLAVPFPPPGVPENDPPTGISNRVMAVAVALAESAGETDAMHTSDDPSSENFGQVDHGEWQISGRWNAVRLMNMGDWRDVYDNARMMSDLFMEWWRKESKPGYEKGKPIGWKPSGWRAWSVYNSGTAWNPTTTNPKNRFVHMAEFGIASPIPAPRSPYRRGNMAPDPVLVQLDELARLQKAHDAASVTLLNTALSYLSGLRKHFT